MPARNWGEVADGSASVCGSAPSPVVVAVTGADVVVVVVVEVVVVATATGDVVEGEVEGVPESLDVSQTMSAITAASATRSGRNRRTIRWVRVSGVR
jgi:hypothetical protein